MLLVGAVVMIQSVQRLMQVDPGFKAANLVSMQLSLPSAHFPKEQNVADFYRDLQQRVAELPGVEKAAVVDELPLTTDGGTVIVIVSGRPEPPPGEQQETVIRSASPDYFETMGIPLKSGRTFTNLDRPSSSNVVILSETLAEKLFGKTDPIGQRVITTFNKAEWNVIGVVGDVRLANLDGGIRPTLYTCALQDPSRSSVLALRTATPVENIASLVRAEVQTMDPELPVYGVRSIEDTINMTPGVTTRRLVLSLVGTFSSIGVLMAGIGLYGLMSFVVVQRTKEIGIRMALGANKQNVRSLVLRQAMMTTAAGLIAGVTIAIAGGRLMQSVIFGVTPSNISVLATVVSLVAMITFIACSVPIRRAVRTDPIVVLRHD
jgi:predicted permease